MATSFAKAAKIIKREVPELINKINNMGGSQYYFNCDHKEGSIDCLYTDGDGGGLHISGFSEVFENEGGVTVQMIGDANYCDVEINDLLFILTSIKKFQKENEQRIYEEEE
ncbi:hypothetical protein N9Y98_02680 [Candidatus Pelagibacter bacterium]|nr:hypothetical protein [Candidatus Pelagibacter bacterium]